ncbi:Slp family lipoprotein [Candidatus Nitrotoga sp. M5]|uniref:Slp family lipoprotein n=1 Tax=Candidatus Nitrotoga sp. M5 TaxID=2890409 RepID=UPI001EF46DFB|nr:Slp family lipoprotein [Candidatus Nitrotoga sp. M5]CAH1387237.1 Starvation lipoprotein Slp paralog [Candidatus Nitrotoga sp. M5]
MNRWIFLIPIAVAGCATVPKPLAVGEFSEATPNAAQIADFVGQRIRWGGSIASTETGKNETCFEIVSHPLDSKARPLDSDMTWGRFIACESNFYDPEVYAKGREVTVVGNIQNTIVRKLGEYEYRYPQVNAETVYLWPKIVPYYGSRYPYYNGYYGSYWYNPWGPWNGGLGRLYW